MNLAAEKPEWVEIAKPPFQRRAVAAIEYEGTMVVVGGMNQSGGPTKSVAQYDPKSNRWSDLPEIPGSKAMAGFGVAGYSVGNKLIVTTQEGAILHWNPNDRQWNALGQATDARFFHRLLPVDQSRLVSIGGANMEIGKFLDLELIQVN
jgi:hypothetical protein